MTSQGLTTRPTSHSGFHNNSPNSSDTRNGPTNVENKVTCNQTAEKEFSAHSAGLITMTQRHAEDNTTISQVPLIATLQRDTTQQQSHYP